MGYKFNIGESMSISVVAKLLARRGVEWPHNWWKLPNVQEAFRAIFTKAAVQVPTPPTWQAPRGIVIAAGGWRFFPSLYVTVKMIRQSGCTLPIQVWYLGDKNEFDPRMGEALAGDGVEWIDGNKEWRARPEMRMRDETTDHGWMLKTFAVAYSPFAQVLALDADCYPVKDPTAFLDSEAFREHGNAFWPDMNAADLDVGPVFGIEPPRGWQIEAGQMVIDKERFWNVCWLTCWLNAHHDYVWRHVYGDKDTWMLAMRKLGLEWWQVTPKTRMEVHSFVHADQTGEPLFIHRTCGKLRRLTPIAGSPEVNEFATQQRTKANEFNRTLPGEADVYRFFTECEAFLDALPPVAGGGPG